uniref:O-acyltransferase WSD1 C-terminal domain-containing protein n=1 Tax=Oryza glumipatula TaxID=40148 RepID=A0A0D9YFF2_9ORYZ
MINSGREDEVKWGNALGFIILPFFIGMHKDPLDYVRKAKKVVDRKKSSLEVVFTHLAAEVILKLFGLKTVNDVLVGITYSALSRYYYRKSGDKDTDEDIQVILKLFGLKVNLSFIVLSPHQQLDPYIIILAGNAIITLFLLTSTGLVHKTIDFRILQV